MEQWDIYNKDGVVLHKTMKRGEPIADGEYHLVVAIWVIDADGKLLVTLRDAAKPSYPNLWENTGGAVLSGETSLEGAMRELKEETGLIASSRQFERLFRFVEQRAIVDQYRLVLPSSCPAITLQKGETQAAKWISPRDFEAMILSDMVALPIAERWYQVKDALFQGIKR